MKQDRLKLVSGRGLLDSGNACFQCVNAGTNIRHGPRKERGTVATGCHGCAAILSSQVGVAGRSA